jgi:hypothetical protein
LLAASLMVPTSSAQKVAQRESAKGLELIGEPVELESRSVTLECFVYLSMGIPAQGAMVLSSAGGRAMADENGSFRLVIQTPMDVENVQVTALGGSAGKSLASQQVQLPRQGGRLAIELCGIKTRSRIVY